MDIANLDINDKARFESLGFICGLEIHQQLATEKKLFCHCPVGLTGRKYDAEILRHMRPTLSELGEYDGTALMEFKTKKEVIYRLYRDRTCTYEMDDTPPFLVNQQAIDYAIRIALLFNCRIVDEIHVIRKQYLDGSIPTGFQRTMIIGVDGWIPYKNRRITITQVNLEEEACREVSDIGHRIVFATDRLSTPLVEIITASDMKNPVEAADVCRLLGNSMKITGLVRRGIGTVRQDVNVSITGSTRVEIKGVFKVGNIKPLTAIEAVRQKRLLELRDRFVARFGSDPKIDFGEENFTSLFSGSGNIIGRRLESDRPLKVVGMHLAGLADFNLHPLQPGWDFASELGGRVRVIACIDSVPNLFFYSHRHLYDIPETVWEKIRSRWTENPGDDIVLVCGPSADVVTALNEIKIRILELAKGVINETRQDMKNGTTDFERILPGPDRMYPDTDHPPIKITDSRVEENRRRLAEPLWEKQKRWTSLGLSSELVRNLSLSPYADILDQLAAENNIPIKRAAYILSGMLIDLRRSGYDLAKADRGKLYQLLQTALSGKWPHRQLKAALIMLAHGDAPNRTTPESFDLKLLDRSWEEIKSKFDGVVSNDKCGKFRRYLTGRLIDRFPHHSPEVLARISERLGSEK
ncbi:Glutamyl-tRNA(Gln) amidotransferase, subunit E [Candidatus Zixiibacteriota bacterium]|nr:Glutamyl-tRNA(Gln) amidotransferase, subunit E [candidate division Zixibacteria bacterium]